MGRLDLGKEEYISVPVELYLGKYFWSYKNVNQNVLGQNLRRYS